MYSSSVYDEDENTRYMYISQMQHGIHRVNALQAVTAFQTPLSPKHKMSLSVTNHEADACSHPSSSPNSRAWTPCSASCTDSVGSLEIVSRSALHRATIMSLVGFLSH